MRNILPHRRAAPILLLLLSGCMATAGVPDPVYSPCHVLGSSDWKAHVEFSSTASPIPYLTRKLVVTGKVVTAGGYYASIGQGPVSRLDEPVQQIMVRTEGSPEAGAAPVTHNVRAVVPALKRYGGVAIRCGDGIIAEIRDVPAPPRQKNENPWRL